MLKLRPLAPLMLCIPLLGQAADWEAVHPFYAEYTGYFKGIPIGSASRQLTVNGDGVYKMTTKATLLAIGVSYDDVSRFIYQDKTILSQGFTHKQRTFLKKRKIVGRPDNKGGLQINDDGKVTHLLANEHGYMIDAGSFSIALQSDVKNDQTPLSYQYAIGDEVDHHQFERLGEERVRTPLGEFDAIKLIQSTNKKRQTYVWLAPALDYQLVKMEIVRKGKRWANLEVTKLKMAQAKIDEAKSDEIKPNDMNINERFTATTGPITVKTSAP
jgi:hypothetical protein